MQINAIDIKKGTVLNYEKRLWVVNKTMHVQPGKGGAFMQVEMKDIKDGTKTNVRFRSSETVERAFLELREFQYLYESGQDIEVMDKTTYEQLTLSKELVGDQAAFLEDGMDISIEFYEDAPIMVMLPETTIAEIAECEPVVKGQTVTSSYKPAVLQNGVRIMVPQFINVGDKVIVKIETQEYLKRAE